MNLKVLGKDKFIIKINSELTDFESIDSKEISRFLHIISKRYDYEIYGFYIVDIYPVSNFFTLLEFNKKDEDDYFRKSVNFKINKHNREKMLTFEDPLLLEKYNKILKTNKVNKKDVLKLCEHYEIIY